MVLLHATTNEQLLCKDQPARQMWQYHSGAGRGRVLAQGACIRFVRCKLGTQSTVGGWQGLNCSTYVAGAIWESAHFGKHYMPAATSRLLSETADAHA